MDYNVYMPPGKRVYNVFMPFGVRVYNIYACSPQVCAPSLITVPSDFENAYWVKFGSATVIGNVIEGPDCQPADQLNVGGTGSAALNSVRSEVITLSGIGVLADVSVWVKRISTTGELMIHNPIDLTLGNYVSGQWRVNMALLSDDWELLTSVHPAVTEDYAFQSGPFSTVQLAFGAANQTVQIYAWCAYLAEI